MITDLPALDRELALSRLGGDDELLREIAILFLGDAQRMMADIKSAAGSRNSEALHRAAHAFKGCVSNFSAGRVYEAALELERIGRSGDFARLEDTLQALESENRKLEYDLRELIAGA